MPRMRFRPAILALTAVVLVSLAIALAGAARSLNLDTKSFSLFRNHRPANFGDVRVAVFEDTPYHDEVIGAVLTVMRDVQANTTLYRRQLHSGFEEVIRDVWDVKEAPLVSPDLFAGHIQAGHFDVIVLVTCDATLWRGGTDVIEAFSTRKDVYVVCLLHEIDNYKRDDANSRASLAVPGAEGRLSFLTLSRHSKDALASYVRKWVSERKEVWNDVDVIDFAPVFNVASASDRNISRIHIPSKAAILGRMEPPSRQYDRIFTQLHQAILADPELWGYRVEPVEPSPDKQDVLGPDDTSAPPPRHKVIPLLDPYRPPFTLYLIGKDYGLLEIPAELVDSDRGSSPVVVKAVDTDYKQFYELIGDMDVILPAFTGRMYIEDRSSAAIPAGIIAQTPVLVDPEVLAAYPYLGEPSYILQPPTMSEVQALGHMRAGRDPWKDVSGEDEPSIDPFYGRPVSGHGTWEKFSHDLRQRNADVMDAVLTWRSRYGRGRGLASGLLKGDSKCEVC